VQDQGVDLAEPGTKAEGLETVSETEIESEPEFEPELETVSETVSETEPLDPSLQRKSKPVDARVESSPPPKEPTPPMIGDSYPGSGTKGTVPGDKKQSRDPRNYGGEAPVRKNDAGLTYDKQKDDCFHLNPTWRGGCCIVNGNAPCTFLGGNQAKCDVYIDRSSEVSRRNTLPLKEGRAMTVVETKE
jgi:hypothetical protein